MSSDLVGNIVKITARSKLNNNCDVMRLVDLPEHCAVTVLTLNATQYFVVCDS